MRGVHLESVGEHRDKPEARVLISVSDMEDFATSSSQPSRSQIHPAKPPEASASDMVERGLLTVTRKVGQEVEVGDPLGGDGAIGFVRIVDIKGPRVSIEFRFRRDTPVNRKELADRMRADAAGESGESGPELVCGGDSIDAAFDRRARSHKTHLSGEEGW